MNPVQRNRVAGVSVLRRDGAAALPTLVLLHGIGSDAQSFLPLIEALPADWPVLAWDAPGYADSSPLAPDSPLPEDYAAALERLLDTLGLAQMTLLGHSLGALVAGRFAATRARRVAALVLASPALGYAVPPGAALPASVQQRIDELAALGPVAFAAQRVARLVHVPAALPGVQRAMAAVRLPGYAQAVRMLGAGDLLAEAPRIAAPSLVVVGCEDAVTPPANARRLVAALPAGARFVELPACGHALPQERPAALAALLAERLVTA